MVTFKMIPNSTKFGFYTRCILVQQMYGTAEITVAMQFSLREKQCWLLAEQTQVKRP